MPCKLHWRQFGLGATIYPFFMIFERLCYRGRDRIILPVLANSFKWPHWPGWAKLALTACSFTWVSHVGTGNQGCVALYAFPRCIRREFWSQVEQPGLEQASILATGAVGSDLPTPDPHLFIERFQCNRSRFLNLRDPYLWYSATTYMENHETQDDDTILILK